MNHCKAAVTVVLPRHLSRSGRRNHSLQLSNRIISPGDVLGGMFGGIRTVCKWLRSIKPGEFINFSRPGLSGVWELNVPQGRRASVQYPFIPFRPSETFLSAAF